MLLLTEDGIIAARDRLGRTPIIIGKKEGAYAVTSESCSLPNLDFEITGYVGPGEIVRVRARRRRAAAQAQRGDAGMLLPVGVITASPCRATRGRNVEEVRFKSGYEMGRTDESKWTAPAAFPIRGVGMALGYAEGKGVPYHRGIASTLLPGRAASHPVTRRCARWWQK